MTLFHIIRFGRRLKSVFDGDEDDDDDDLCWSIRPLNKSSARCAASGLPLPAALA
jgi:hypothetical protein